MPSRNGAAKLLSVFWLLLAISFTPLFLRAVVTRFGFMFLGTHAYQHNALPDLDWAGHVARCTGTRRLYRIPIHPVWDPPAWFAWIPTRLIGINGCIGVRLAHERSPRNRRTFQKNVQNNVDLIFKVVQITTGSVVRNGAIYQPEEGGVMIMMPCLRGVGCILLMYGWMTGIASASVTMAGCGTGRIRKARAGSTTSRRAACGRNGRHGSLVIGRWTLLRGRCGMRKWLAVALLAVAFVLGGVSESQAWRPSGWVYFKYPYAYERNSGDWYWFNTSDTQWVHGFSAGGWQHLDASALANGWSWQAWPYAFSKANSSWYYLNQVDGQWVINLSTGVWTVFGIPPPPDGMVTIPAGTNAGTNLLGGSESYSQEYVETYSLTVATFYMDRYEVTKALWDEVYAWAGANGYTFDNEGSGKDTNHPVHTVNWYDCVKWCNARSESEGREAAYYTDAVFTQRYQTGQVDHVFVKETASGYRLPTEQQWEYAARGGAVGRRFPWSDSDEIQHTRANYVSSTTQGYDTSLTRGTHPDHETGDEPYTSPVGSFAANGYGVFDMAGNVAEWCFDLLPDVWSSRVVRGGFWNHISFYCRVGYHYWDRPVYADDDFGFRTVLPAASVSAR